MHGERHRREKIYTKKDTPHTRRRTYLDENTHKRKSKWRRTNIKRDIHRGKYMEKNTFKTWKRTYSKENTLGGGYT